MTQHLLIMLSINQEKVLAMLSWIKSDRNKKKKKNHEIKINSELQLLHKNRVKVVYLTNNVQFKLHKNSVIKVRNQAAKIYSKRLEVNSHSQT